MSYPEVRELFMDQTGKELWDDNGSASKDYLQWLEDYVLSHQ